ncbi:GumC family protein, partial [Flavobacterium sp.]|uniref:GumC family protein n=1 Tax=Flavobacterium sp. TaxID=239 RepID=UPI002B7885F6
MENYNSIEDNFAKDFDLKAFFDKYLVHWKWFVLSIIVFLISAFLYIRYIIPQYEASTTILVKDESRGSMLSELSAFSDIGVGEGVKSNVDNEIEILKSRTLIESTVKKLNLNVRIFAKGSIRDVELYKNAPIDVMLINPEKGFYKNGLSLSYTEIGPDTFELKNDSEDEESTTKKTANNDFHYGQLIATQYGHIVIRKSKDRTNNDVDINSQLRIMIVPLDGMVSSFSQRLSVKAISKVSSVVNVSIQDPVPGKAEEFLDNLIEIYNRKAVGDKNFIAENTYEFINNRLRIITEELEGVEKNVESFKTSNKVTDIESEADLYVKGSDDYVKKGVETEIQLNMVSSMLAYIKKSNSTDLLPTNIVGSQGDAGNLINSYNELVLQRNKVLKSATLENPSVIKLDQQIASLKSNVVASLLRMESNLTIQKENLKHNEGLLNNKIGMIPVQEHQFRVIARQQKVKEELYLYLLKKREETAISLSTTEPNARVIDAGKAGKYPVSPKTSMIYLAAILLGLFIPFMCIYVINLLDTKIKSRLDLEGKTAIPFIGDIPTSHSPSEIMRADSRSSSAEALRMVKTNLEFMLSKDGAKGAKTIFVTSTFPKEGKTFVSANLAA